MNVAIPILTGLLGMLALLHILCGVGVWFPIADQAALSRAVIGIHGRKSMPGPVACGVVAVALLAAAWVLWWVPGGIKEVALILIAAVFTARGLAAYLPAWRRLAPAEPFATLDRFCYGPLCLALGLVFLAFALG
jgi:hypothetical protein